MQKWASGHLELTSATSMRRFSRVKNDPSVLADHLELRHAVLDFLADFADWDNSTSPAYLATARELTRAAHVSLGGDAAGKPLVVDPFAGGGAIPLETLRVGADAFASDLNPIPVLLNKAALEYMPKFGATLADGVRKWGSWVKEKAEKSLGDLYPRPRDGTTPMSYLWARTIQCEGPGCGAVVPMMRGLSLAKKGNKSVVLEMLPHPRSKKTTFRILRNDGGTWHDQDDPKTRLPKPSTDGTVQRGSVSCPCCGYTTPVARVREQLQRVSGGARTAQLVAVVSVKAGQQGRLYRLPTRSDLDAIEKAETAVNEQISSGRVPADTLPLMSGVFNAPLYGHTSWASLFNSRQLLAMITFAELVSQVGEEIRKEGGEAGYADAVQTFLAFALSKQADLGNALCTWEPIAQCPRHLFGRQAIGMVWDYAEAVPLSQSSGGFDVFVDGIARTLEGMGNDWQAGAVARASASQHPLPSDSAACIFTDPPYYNAVPYADLSDFFYIWLKRSIGKVHGDLLAQPLTPKADEICEMAGWDPVRYPHKTGSWYESQMTKAMDECRRILAPDGIGIVVFAHKSTTGWEAQLQAMIAAGWVIVGSWPIDTENASRLRAQGSAALASSVHLVCRPREDKDGSLRDDAIGDWRAVLAELPIRIHDWMPRLADEGVVGADAIFACLGPALEIFSRHSRVEKASGEVVTLREYLEQVWAAVSTEALSMIFRDADAAGLESDARFTAIVLWTLGAGGSGSSDSDAGDAEDTEGEDEDDESPTGKTAKGGYTLEYDAARKIAQGLGVNLEQIDSVVEVKGDKARLRPVSERAATLFGKAEKAEAATKKRGKKATQKKLFDKDAEEGSGKTETVTFGDGAAATPGVTALDRVHQAMLLFAGGRADALKRFIVEDGVGGDARFWKLAQSLSALYPAGSDEKRWVDGVLARKKSFGF